MNLLLYNYGLLIIFIFSTKIPLFRDFYVVLQGLTNNTGCPRPDNKDVVRVFELVFRAVNSIFNSG